MLCVILSSLLTTFKSVAAAFFGVQSESARKRDFSQGKLSHFIVVGIILLSDRILICSYDF